MTAISLSLALVATRPLSVRGARRATRSPPRRSLVAQAGYPAPPPPQAEAVPPPRAGWVWVPGIHEWRGRRYVWVPGRWEHERRGRMWRAAALGDARRASGLGSGRVGRGRSAARRPRPRRSLSTSSRRRRRRRRSR